MQNEIKSAEYILQNNIDGFHRYCLSSLPMRIDYAGQNLCDMLGCRKEDLIYEERDGYAAFIHPDDMERYHRFLCKLAGEERRETVQYRLITASGAVLYIHDSMTSRRDENGRMEGYSTLTDVTEIKKENDALHTLNETVPCGILKYTCEESPMVTYANDQMLRILRFPENRDSSAEYIERFGRNIYLFIAPEERNRFHQFLEYAASQDKPAAGETTVMCYDGSRVRLYGWISMTTDENGRVEYQSVCMDVTDRYERKNRAEGQRYLRALTQVYDEIAEFDLSKNTVRFLHGHYCGKLGNMAGMPMMMDAVVEHWLENAVVEQDRAQVRSIFDELAARDAGSGDLRPPQVEFCARFSDGSVRNYLGVMLKTGHSTWLFCCRNTTQQQEAAQLKAENIALRGISEQMHELVMHFTDGMLAFELRGDAVRPLYYSENIRQFFGYTREEWMSIMETLTPIRDFVSKCHIPYDVFLELLEGRDAEFSFTDTATRTPRRYKAIRSAGTPDDNQSSYVMIFDVTPKSDESSDPAIVSGIRSEVFIRTFGYFDVFVDGTPIAFRNEKAKELFALLADRRGGYISSAEAIACLWEDEPANSVTLARYRKVALRLKNTLEEYGIGDTMESVDGKRRLVTQRVVCDLYQYLSGDSRCAQLFKGNYLQNYSWGERTLAELENRS